MSQVAIIWFTFRFRTISAISLAYSDVLRMLSSIILTLDIPLTPFLARTLIAAFSIDTIVFALVTTLSANVQSFLYNDFVASSAGVMLADKVNQVVVEVMKEKGIDISEKKPKLLTTKMAEEADIIITMGCSVEKFCPAPLLQNVIDWELEDPKGKPIEKVRQIRDEIERRVQKLIDEIA